MSAFCSKFLAKLSGHSRQVHYHLLPLRYSALLFSTLSNFPMPFSTLMPQPNRTSWRRIKSVTAVLMIMTLSACTTVQVNKQTAAATPRTQTHRHKHYSTHTHTLTDTISIFTAG